MITPKGDRLTGDFEYWCNSGCLCNLLDRLFKGLFGEEWVLGECDSKCYHHGAGGARKQCPFLPSAVPEVPPEDIGICRLSYLESVLAKMGAIAAEDMTLCDFECEGCNHAIKRQF